MPGLGTIINVALLIAGGLLGLIGGRFITPRIQDTLMKASGLCVLFIGLGGTMQKMLVIDGKTLATTGTTMLIVTHNNAIKNMVHQVVLLKDGQIHKNYRNEVRTPAACITPCRSWASGCRACCWYMHW